MGKTRMYQLVHGINVDNNDDKKEIEQRVNQHSRGIVFSQDLRYKSVKV